jgi:hypothetical protein
VDRVVLVAFVVLGAALIVGFGRIGQAAADFVLKDEQLAAPGELFTLSRGDKVDRSLENFRDAPVLGVGFGTPSDVTLLSARREMVYGIVVSASSEKGFLPTAVLEEIGLFGAAFVTLILIAMALPVHRRGSFGVIWVFWAALIKNVGDSVFLSLGGFGLLMWLFAAFAYNQSVAEEVPGVGPTAGG